MTVSTGNGTELVFLRQAIGRRLDPPAPAVPDEPDDGVRRARRRASIRPRARDAAPTGEEPDKK